MYCLSLSLSGRWRYLVLLCPLNEDTISAMSALEILHYNNQEILYLLSCHQYRCIAFSQTCQIYLQPTVCPIQRYQLIKDTYFQEMLQCELVKKMKHEIYHKLISFSQTMSHAEIDMRQVKRSDHHLSVNVGPVRNC